ARGRMRPARMAGRGGSAELAVTVLVLLAAAARARIVAANLGHGSGRGAGRGGGRGSSSRGVLAAQGLIVVRMMVLHVLHVRLRRLGLGLVDLLGRLDAHRHQDLDDVVAYPVEHAGEEFEGFTLVFLLGVLLR